MEPHDLKRRTLLLGLAAACLTGLVPLSSCGRKSSEEGDFAPETAPAPTPMPGEGQAAPEMGSDPSEPGKITQAQAEYQNQPKGEQRCANCLQFIAESDTCKVVEGTVSPLGWCKLWAPKMT